MFPGSHQIDKPMASRLRIKSFHKFRILRGDPPVTLAALTRAAEKKKTAVKNYTISAQGVGDILTIKLDADFYYINNQKNSVRCPRYYSSYTVHKQIVCRQL